MTSKFQLLPADVRERLEELPGWARGLERLAALWLFGSMSRGEATPVSDVDLAYLPEADCTGEKLDRFDTELYSRIAATLHTDEFTLVNLNTAPAYVVWNVLKEGRLLVCRNAAAVRSVAETIYQISPDIAWLRRIGNEQFLQGVRMPDAKIDRQRIAELLRLITEDVQRVRQKTPAKKEDYLGSQDLQAIVERRLQTAAEGCINIGNHLIARLGLRAPQDYADVFKVLSEAGILPDPLAPQMIEMARFRNLLVHIYWGIDHARVYDALAARLATVEAFIQTIVRWLDEQA